MNGMWRDAWFLASRGIWIQLRMRETIIWTFVMPVVFIYFIGSVTGHAFGPSDTRDALAVSAAPGAGFLADALADRLAALDYRLERPASRRRFLQFGRRLEIPAGFTASVLAGKPMKVHFESTGEAADAGYDQVRIARAVYGLLADVSAASGGSAGVTAQSLAAVAAAPRTLTLDVRAAGKRLEVPSGFDQAVPGILVMFVLLVMFTSGGVTLTIERRMGLLRRLASSPMSRAAVVLGRWGSRMALGIIQIAFAMLAGWLLFHIHWGRNLPMVILILLAYAALAAALGMLLGNFGRSEGQVIGLGVLLSNILAALGGCWWPIEIEPLWARKAALVLPTGWTMDALHKLVNFGASPAAVLPHLAVSVAGAALAGWILARSFRFSQD